MNWSKRVATRKNLTKIRIVPNCNCILHKRVSKQKTFWATECILSRACLKEVHVGYKRVFLPQLLITNHSNNCLTYENYTKKSNTGDLCLFRAWLFNWTHWQTWEKNAQIVWFLLIKKGRRWCNHFWISLFDICSGRWRPDQNQLLPVRHWRCGKSGG